MKSFIFLITIFFFIGCGNGGGGGDSSANQPQDNTNVLTLFSNATQASQSLQVAPYENNNLIADQWYLQKTNFIYYTHMDAHIHPDATTYQNYTGQGVKVAIIDNGFDTLHPELRKNISRTIAFSKNNDGTLTQTTDVSQNKGDFHGSAVAGIIAASDHTQGIRGVAPNVELILIKIPFDVGLASNDLIKIFGAAADAGADIIHCSWGSSVVSPSVEAYIDHLATNARSGKGIVFVFAAGNSNTFISGEATLESVISVGATDVDNIRTSYSNYGSSLDIVAPGGKSRGISTIDVLGVDGLINGNFIMSTNLTSTGSTISFTGTSASAPIVTGCIALLMQKFPSMSRQEIQDKLASSADLIETNLPYLDEMQSFNTPLPTITGIFGTFSTQNLTLKIKNITTNTTVETTTIKIGTYDSNYPTKKTFYATLTHPLSNGEYEAQIYSTTGELQATDLFIVDSAGGNIVDTTKRKNIFYGYGKINLGKLLL